MNCLLPGVLGHQTLSEANTLLTDHNKPIKVLQVATSGVTFKALLMPLVVRLEAEGYEVHLTCAAGTWTQELESSRNNVTTISIERRVTTISNLKALWQLYRLMRKECFDVVHVHTPVAAAVGRMAAIFARVPVILYTAHGFYFHDRMSPFVRTPIVWIEKLLGRITDMLMTQSEEDAKTAVTEGICHSAKVRWIGNGVDVRRFVNGNDRRSWQGIERGDSVVGFVGRMVREKGIIELIQALGIVVKTMPNVKLLMVGDTLDDDRDTEAKGEIRRLIQDYDLGSNVVFTGFIDDVASAMAAMDIFTLPSYREGMPRTIIEAMASGKPVVATDIRGCREEVLHGVTGLLVPPGDPQALADALIELLSDPLRAQRMGQAGRKRAQELFDENLVLDREMEVYRDLVQARFGT